MAALSLSIAVPAGAQSSGNIPDDYYRAEIVILERLVDPDTISEQMAGKTTETLEPAKKRMWVEDPNGNGTTDLRLAPTRDLHLSSAINRLERSGKYRVLASAGWYEAFPPDYKGEPLQVETGEWLPEARQHSVEGRITIDRQRFLHVNVQLNHWQVDDVAMPVMDTTQPAADAAVQGSEAATNAGAEEQAGNTNTDSASAAAGSPELAMPPVPLELITWIRETRRMRSEEIHFIDSPTIGVLVFFKKIEAEG
ncbi:MAG: 5'-methylthioadenosine phosphorylase [Marinobacter sp. 34-60-7]|nr:MAG: 5'-methylthioadenosine phosphorylase [Marinobacter sp. 34-60-7]